MRMIYIYIICFLIDKIIIIIAFVLLLIYLSRFRKIKTIAFQKSIEKLSTLEINGYKIKKINNFIIPPEIESQLSERQKQIFRLILNLHSLKEMTYYLNVSKSTIQTHVERITEKINIRGGISVIIKWYIEKYVNDKQN